MFAQKGFQGSTGRSTDQSDGSESEGVVRGKDGFQARRPFLLNSDSFIWRHETILRCD